MRALAISLQNLNKWHRWSAAALLTHASLLKRGHCRVRSISVLTVSVIHLLYLSYLFSTKHQSRGSGNLFQAVMWTDAKIKALLSDERTNTKLA